MDSLIEIFGPYLIGLFIAVLVVSGIDLYFDNSKALTYGISVKMNALNAVFFIIASIMWAIFIFNSSVFKSDAANNYAVIIAVFITMFFVKSVVLKNHGVELSWHYLVTSLGLIVLALPYYLPYRVLSGMKMGN